MEKSKKWKTLVQVSKEANSFSGKKGDKFDGRGYFPNKNAKLANEVEEKAKAKVQGSAIKPKRIKSVYEDYEEEVLEKQIGNGMTSVPSKMKKHKVDSTQQSGAGIKYINPDNNYKQVFPQFLKFCLTLGSQTGLFRGTRLFGFIALGNRGALQLETAVSLEE